MRWSFLLRPGIVVCLLVFTLGTAPSTGLAAEARLLRFPAIHGDSLVFGYAGDLYQVAATGGVARRLTSDPQSYEMFPRYSPDGRHLAFTAQYDGNTEVYVMPAQGGIPRRLTYTATLERDDVSDRMGPNNIVMTWRDNETVVYRSRRIEWNDFKGQLYLARLDGGLPEPLPLPRAGWCSFSPDGRQVAYNRIFREFRTWKRYRGGQADEIWLYDFASRATSQLTTNLAQDIYPMWKGDRVYFVSERDENGQANLFVLDLKTHETRQLTQFKEFAVKFPSLGDQDIVFENGGFIHRLNLATEQTTRIPIEIREDFASGRETRRDLGKNISSFHLAPDGARALLGARGELFTVPAKHGPTRNLTRTPGVHERAGVWSPDGLWIAYLSDQSGEDEVWIRPQDGTGEPRQLTTQGDTYKYDLAWSPDSRLIAWTDKKNRLQFVNIDTKAVVLVAQSEAWEIQDFRWSPDSRWIVFHQPEVRRFPNLYLYGLDAARSIRVTDGWFDVGEPTFSSDGKYLFFVSERSFNPTYGASEWNHVYTDMQRLYAITLAKETPSPIAPKSDEVKTGGNEKPKDTPPDVKSTDRPVKTVNDLLQDPEFRRTVAALAQAGASNTTATPPIPAGTNATPRVVVKVDAEGIQERITVLPPGPSTYGNLTSVGDKLYFQRKGKLILFEFDKEKETELGEVGGYRVSADQKKMLVQIDGGFAMLDLPTAKLETKDKTLSLGDVQVTIDRRAEWNQIYAECWRQMRDFFYAPNMHGVDWAAMRRRYEPLLEHVQHRADLSYIIGELIGELNAGHAYVGGGDYPKAERVPMGLLGARFSKDASGYFRIDRILRGQNWEPKYRSPLTDIGVNVKTGEFILSINGRTVRDLPDLHQALVGTAGKQVRLRVNSAPREEGARDEVVIPTDNEQDLYYLEWVLGNIEKVDQATGGRVGYVHIPDMGVHGLNEFAKFYYPQIHKQALIVDCRGNGGGNVSPQIIERLRREPVFWTVARNGSVNFDPAGQVLGPKVLLLDPFSASDGDIVAYRFRTHKLGPIIGKRSWGGVVGIRGSLPLLDGGYLNRPEFSRFDLEAREWVIEGVGVEPDIDVDNDPAHEFDGIDDQLNRAIEEIQKELERRPIRVPALPPYPDKSR
ncbi:MAG: PD40 domain-containing protein [Verrucomicrobiales bacterium]|nr:PD40 domain-containing protein [Verrucomicrobiales bacterium]